MALYMGARNSPAFKTNSLNASMSFKATSSRKMREIIDSPRELSTKMPEIIMMMKPSKKEKSNFQINFESLFLIFA
jgi:hypothetical protein